MRKSRSHEMGRKVQDEDILDLVLNSKDQIFIMEEFFTTEIARNIGSTKNVLGSTPVYVISDIRTLDVDDESPPETDIILNSYQQLVWAYILGANAYSFKFRLPYYSSFDLDILAKEYLEKERDFDGADEIRALVEKFWGIDILEDIKNGKFRNVFNPVPTSDLVSELDIEESAEYRDQHGKYGQIYFQVWAPVKSTETRLVGTHFNNMRNYEN